MNALSMHYKKSAMSNMAFAVMIVAHAGLRRMRDLILDVLYHDLGGAP